MRLNFMRSKLYFFMRSKLIIIFSQFQSGGRHFHHKTKVANNAFLSFDLMKNGNFC